MADSANVHSIDAISELRAALLRYGDEAKQALLAADQELQRTEDWLRDRLNYWRHETERREEIARQMLRAYEACRANLICDENGRCYPPPCSREQAHYEEAVRYFRAAQNELQTAQSWAQRIKQAVGEYQTNAHRLSQVANSEMPQAAAWLHNVADRLYAYTVEAMPIAATPSSQSSGETVSSLDALGQLVGGLAAAPLVATLAGLGLPTENANPLTSSPSAEAALQQRVDDLARETHAREQAELEEIQRQQANTLPSPPATNTPSVPPPGWRPHSSGETERPPDREAGVEQRY